MKVLFINVGGSDVPIVTSIKKHRPDYVIFFATETTGKNNVGSRETIDGDGLVCKDRPMDGSEPKDRPCIVTQTELSTDRYEIVIVKHDDPYDTYMKAEPLIAKYIDEKYDVLVDYTGGTKSMSAGLASAGMEHPDCTLTVVTGARISTVRVLDGMERIAKLPMNKVFIQRQLNSWRKFFSQRDYYSAQKVIEIISTYGGDYDDDGTIERLDYLSRGFAEWDRFNYQNALKYISLYKDEEQVSPYNVNLNLLIATIKFYKEWSKDSKNKPPGNGFLLVYDLMYNAKRKGEQGYYDDAVARIYRATEMYAQFCLMTANQRMSTDDIQIYLLPEDCRPIFEAKRDLVSKRIKVGLRDAYEILGHLDHPVGQVWRKWEKKVINENSKRNYSYLAHGIEPITKEQFEEMFDAIWTFFIECDEAMKFKKGIKDYLQLPTEI